MTISYNWLCDYLPLTIEPENLSRILTSIGLEVEKMDKYEEVKGGLAGLVIGEVMEVMQHPNADKLKVARVAISGGETLQIVCGAPNVAEGQKVVVAPVGATIFPTTGEPLTMKVAKIRGTESFGMICAEDEIGIGSSHAGIMVLPLDAMAGTPAASYFKPYSDIIFEIGLTPNRMDAMSHLGVARDVCAYLTHHDRKEVKPVLPKALITVENKSLPIKAIIENSKACARYSGITIAQIKVQESPKWIKDRLKAIGLRPINNIVDITNYVLHETGQPLHAFNYDAIAGKQIIVKNLPDNTPFKTLDDKERSLSNDDLMICDAEKGMCLAGVFGGEESGVVNSTKNIFLESAFFDPATIRKTSFRHNLRTDAATRFEKGTDISNTVFALKRAALLIKEIGGGEISSDVIDLYPNPKPKTEIILKNGYLKKLSGKNYHSETVKRILSSLGFVIIKETIDALSVEVPYHKPDVQIPADVVEEILRIDGLDNIEIPGAITITPSVEINYKEDALKEKVAGFLIGTGFNEILTNSITNSKYLTEKEVASTVRLLNNLSSELDVLRPVMLPTALEVIAFNINRKNTDLQLFEFGKTYKTVGIGDYKEQNHLCLYVCGQVRQNSWRKKSENTDIYFLKGIVNAVLQLVGLSNISFEPAADSQWQQAIAATINGDQLVTLGKINSSYASLFDVKNPVFSADFNWDLILKLSLEKGITVTEVPKYPAMERDLALVVRKQLNYNAIKKEVENLNLSKLKEVTLFDVFESEKLGLDKKSLAVHFTFLDTEKTLTDKEIDSWMNKIINTLEKELGAEIRK